MALMTVHIPYNLTRDEVFITPGDLINIPDEDLEDLLHDICEVAEWLDRDEVVTRIFKSATLIRELYPEVRLVDALQQALIWERG
jgi:hypothetical protein